MAGEIVHIEFPAKNVDRSQAFWSGLFGWTFGESAMPTVDYRMAKTSPTSGAAVFESSSGIGHPSYYFDTEDIEASLAKVRELGGGAEEAAPVPGHGWYAACHDSEGNEFHLWQSDPTTA